ncbi:hypothetical protein [Oceanicella actignis]|uniref:hypothetical protein n=1 Tax=Oceanicella actignis TaxID=1189325 RepID=UPI0015A61A9A|nr:hypothetical protein [Oceanicella actignis]
MRMAQRDGKCIGRISLQTPPPRKRRTPRGARGGPDAPGFTQIQVEFYQTLWDLDACEVVVMPRRF